MRKYFLYELKKNALLMAIISVIMLLIYLSSLEYRQNSWFGTYDLNLYTISALGGVAAAVLPVIMFAYKMKKRNLDLYYALPITHRRILTVKYLVGLICLYAPYTLAYVLGMAINVGVHGDMINAIYYLPHYFSTLIPLFILYSVSAFLFTRANTLIDGIVTVVAAAFAPAVICLALNVNIDDKIFAPYFWTPYAPIDTATTYFQRLIIPDATPLKYNLAEQVNMWIAFPLWTVAAGLATFFTIHSEKNAKAENVGQITKSWFSYKTMLPLYTFCLTMLIMYSTFKGFDTTMFAIYIVALVGVYLCAVYYKRSLKIGVTTTISIASSAVAAFLLLLILRFAI